MPLARDEMMNDKDQSTVAAQGPHRSLNENKNSEQRATTLRDRFKQLLGIKPPSLRDNLQEALAAPQTSHFSPGERAILQNVLKLRDTRVDDVMVPRIDIEAIETTDTMGFLISRFHEAAHSRLPVFDDGLDNVVGMVHIKDAVQRMAIATTDQDDKAGPVKFVSSVLRKPIGELDLIRQVLFVPPSMPVNDLLQSMQATHVHMALVIDEYGGTDGLVTIEDLLEAVVGEIEDEHDDAEADLVQRVDENSFIADARVELEELQAIIGADFAPGEAAEEVSTLGGLLFELVDHVPARGELITKLKGFEFEILAADPRRIKKVRIVRRRRLVSNRRA